MAKKKILVIGGGFGGVFAAKALERRGRDEFDIELINILNHCLGVPAAGVHSPHDPS